MTPVNDPPVANDDSASTDEDTTLTIEVLANDNDVDNDILTVSSVTEPAHGTLVINSDATITYNPDVNFNGYDTFNYTADDGNGATDTAMVSIEVKPVNDAPVLNAIGNKSVQWGDELTFTATASDAESPPQTLTFHLKGTVPAGAEIDEPTGAFSWTPTSAQIGSHTFRVEVTDNGVPSLSDNEEITITVSKRPTTLVYNGDTSEQYSDQVSLSATLTDAGNENPLSDQAVTFMIGSQSTSASTNTSGIAEATIILDQPAGSYTVDSIFAENAIYLESSDSDTFTILHEDADIVFDTTNPVAEKVESPGGDSGSFSLIVNISEAIPDLPADSAYPGDIGLAQVSVELVPVGPGGPVSGTCTPGSVEGTGYDAYLPVTCTFDNVPVNTYTVQVTVVGDYYQGDAEDVLVVYDPSLGFTTGGGWFYWPGTTNKTNFGYTMKYNKQGEQVKGSLLLIRHLPNGTVYRVKSNAIFGLAIGEQSGYGWASFSGKCTYLEPGWLEPEGNHEFTVYVEDRNEPGTGTDHFWIKVQDKNGNGIADLSMGDEATENTEPLEGGNVVVPHQ